MKLLLLHPLPLDGSIFSDDLRGLNDVCAAPTLYEAGDDITAWARAALDAVGADPVVIVGNSIGGSCAIEVARLAPTKVKALVLCGVKPGHRPEPASRDDALHVLSHDGLRAAWLRYWRPLFGPTASPDVVERGWLAALQQGPEAIAAGVRAFHGRPDREAFLGAWTGPVWLVNGEHDIATKGVHALAKRRPGASSRTLPGVGHYVPLEAPEALATITAEALTMATR
ncbi:MAG TPA: alpha/beta hydrolase [Egicoccus sp.]|nr:alpha/beta hydrolase [Egicoccus sp.]HSK21622.1 alpha/beta hydrolase [Egicoccus sp.]